ncbi:MAG: WcaF family extracellular polysaccharide biosynthesis acetyltransferase [Hyphomicrobium sp.]
MNVRLKDYDTAGFDRGRSRAIEGLWLLLDACFVSSWLPGSAHRRLLLKVFGAKIGRGVAIKPHVRIKFPWKLTIGDDTWIGESVWIDNLAPVDIGSNCCISQGAYLCTGSHQWTSPVFDLVVGPIHIASSVWIGAKAAIGPGVTAGEGAVLALASVALRDLDDWSVYQGNPAVKVKDRRMTDRD